MTDFLRIPVGPGALHVERFGFGERAVVLLHGFGTSGFLWRNVAPVLPLGRMTAYAIDFYGHGESDRDPEADFGIQAQAAYLDQALTILRVASADVVAVDVGCAVALALAARRAARVRSLVLVNPADPAALRGADFTELRRLQARHLLDASRGMMGARLLLGPLLERSVAQPARMSPALVGRYVAPFVGRDGVRHLLELARAVNDHALEGVGWMSVAAPVLVVRGDADAWALPTVSAALASRLAQGELRRVPDAGRLVPEDAPEAMTALLTDWLARTGDKAAAP